MATLTLSQMSSMPATSSIDSNVVSKSTLGTMTLKFRIKPLDAKNSSTCPEPPPSNVSNSNISLSISDLPTPKKIIKIQKHNHTNEPIGLTEKINIKTIKRKIDVTGNEFSDDYTVIPKKIYKIPIRNDTVDKHTIDGEDDSIGAIENNVAEPAVDVQEDTNVMVKPLRIMGKYYWVGTEKPFIYDPKTKQKIGFIKEDFFIDWLVPSKPPL